MSFLRGCSPSGCFYWRFQACICSVTQVPQISSANSCASYLNLYPQFLRTQPGTGPIPTPEYCQVELKKHHKSLANQDNHVFFLKNFEVLKVRSVLSKLGLNFLRNVVALPSLIACSAALYYRTGQSIMAVL